MLTSKYTLFRNGYLWEWHATFHKDLLRNYHLKCGSRIARRTKTSFLELPDTSGERNRWADLYSSTWAITTWGLFRWNQELLSLRELKTHQPTFQLLSGPQHGQAEKPTDICWIRDDVSSYCFKLKARNLSRIRESLEKIRNWKITSLIPLNLTLKFFQLKFLTECHMHGTWSGPGDRTAKQDRSVLERSPAKSL